MSPENHFCKLPYAPAACPRACRLHCLTMSGPSPERQPPTCLCRERSANKRRKWSPGSGVFGGKYSIALQILLDFKIVRMLEATSCEETPNFNMAESFRCAERYEVCVHRCSVCSECMYRSSWNLETMENLEN